MQLFKLIFLVVGLAVGLAAGHERCPDGIPEEYCSNGVVSLHTTASCPPGVPQGYCMYGSVSIHSTDDFNLHTPAVQSSSVSCPPGIPEEYCVNGVVSLHTTASCPPGVPQGYCMYGSVSILSTAAPTGEDPCPPGVPQSDCPPHTRVGSLQATVVQSLSAVDNVITPAPTATTLTHAPIAIRDYTTDGVVIQRPIGWIDKACAFDGMEKDDEARHECVKECLHLYSEKKCLNSRCALHIGGLQPGQCFCTCGEKVKDPQP